MIRGGPQTAPGDQIITPSLALPASSARIHRKIVRRHFSVMVKYILLENQE
jgi:hypothetical protein